MGDLPDSGPLTVALAADCETLRRSLLAEPLPPVWQLEPLAAQAMFRELTLAALADWRPATPFEAIRVDSPSCDDGVPPLRVLRAAGSDQGSCVVWFHGGGWVLGDLDTSDPVARTVCGLTGRTVINVGYRCAPDHRFPAAVDDCLAATDWALERYARVVVAGDSAGGNLAAVVAQLRSGHPGLVGQVLVYPTSDPRMRSASAHEFVDGPFLTRRDMEWYYDQYLPTAQDYRSPLVDLCRGLESCTSAVVAAVIMTAGHDPLRDEGIAYARQLSDAGTPVTWIHAPELYHGAYSNSGFLPSAAARVEQVWSAAHALFS